MLIFFFERHGCYTPAEKADETIYRVTKKIAGGEQIQNLPGYCYAVARNVLHEYWKDPGRGWAALDADLEGKMPSTDPRESERERHQMEQNERRVACMKKCLQRLGDEEREFITRYCTVKNRKELAAQSGLTLNALRIRVNRIRVELRKCVKGCLNRHEC